MNDAVLEKIQRWWLSIFGDKEELKKQHILPAPTAYKAQLKRCATTESVMLTEGFRALWLSLPDDYLEKASAQHLESMAVIAGVLVYITENGRWRLASAAGRTVNDKKLVNEQRFHQLVNSRNANELLRRLRRVVQQLKNVKSENLKGGLSVVDLARDIGRWFDEKNQVRPRSSSQKLAVRWAMDYFQANRIK